MMMMMMMMNLCALVGANKVFHMINADMIDASNNHED